MKQEYRDFVDSIVNLKEDDKIFSPSNSMKKKLNTCSTTSSPTTQYTSIETDRKKLKKNESSTNYKNANRKGIAAFIDHISSDDIRASQDCNDESLWMNALEKNGIISFNGSGYVGGQRKLNYNVKTLSLPSDQNVFDLFDYDKIFKKGKKC